MLLQNNIPIKIEKTNYVVVAAMTAGTVTLSMSMDGLPFVDIPEAAWSASTAVQLALPSCTLKATLTGDAQVAVGDIRSSLR